jgi:hypothetical protein
LEFLAKAKGEKYVCDTCGLVLLVEEPCECEDTCEIMCCKEPMKKVKPKTSTKPAAKPAVKK